MNANRCNFPLIKIQPGHRSQERSEDQVFQEFISANHPSANQASKSNQVREENHRGEKPIFSRLLPTLSECLHKEEELSPWELLVRAPPTRNYDNEIV